MSTSFRVQKQGLWEWNFELW